MSPELRCAILPAADGQPSITTRHPVAYQEAVTAAATEAEQWLAEPLSHSLVDLLNNWMERMPGSVRTPFREAFLLRLEQRLRASSTAGQVQIDAAGEETISVVSAESQQSVEDLNDE
ncbi:LasR-specific antiactivator QslA [Pseudomonas sp. W5-01]|uniref:LasR-specific antiactivator QslA n=1 Tax=Pseudomonas sp. W5-01 TaxID=3097454 RepID=UPI00397BC7AD